MGSTLDGLLAPQSGSMFRALVKVEALGYRRRALLAESVKTLKADCLLTGEPQDILEPPRWPLPANNAAHKAQVTRLIGRVPPDLVTVRIRVSSEKRGQVRRACEHVRCAARRRDLRDHYVRPDKQVLGTEQEPRATALPQLLEAVLLVLRPPV